MAYNKDRTFSEMCLSLWTIINMWDQHDDYQRHTTGGLVDYEYESVDNNCLNMIISTTYRWCMASPLTFNPELQISEIHLQISEIQFQISKIEFPISLNQFQISEIPFQIFKIQFYISGNSSNLGYLKLYFRYLNWNFRYL